MKILLPLRKGSVGYIGTYWLLGALLWEASNCLVRPQSLSDERKPFFNSELLFPLEDWHNHGSCIVEAPNGDLIVCWFHGSGERKADDVRIEGTRLRKGERKWGPRFTMADTPGFPDTNCCMLIDPMGRLWLLWPTILANEWHTALMKYRISSDYDRDGPPLWEVNEVLPLIPGEQFETQVLAYARNQRRQLDAASLPEPLREKAVEFLDQLERQASDKLFRRLGWMTRAHPMVLDGGRLIVPLYSDGYSFSIMAITDDWGTNWHASAALPGPGNIQPSIVQRSDGSLYALMRDNGPPPKRLLSSESRDRGETWSAVTDSTLPNPGSGAEVIRLKNGHWLLIGNDTESGRHSLAVMLSDDEGKTWRWKRHLESDPRGSDYASFHYPSVIQAADGTLHASYSYHLTEPRSGGGSARPGTGKSIKHAHFNETWVMEGDSKSP